MSHGRARTFEGKARTFKSEQELRRQRQDIQTQRERLRTILRRIRNAYLSLKCPGCKNTFTSKGNHCLKVLRCGHSLCKVCVPVYTVKCTCFCPVDNVETIVERKLATNKQVAAILERLELLFSNRKYIP
ncbi:hypothetical protein Bpfe_007210 [Biomphalaria pfeifferi]|uniref:RING-type domain-containing protein n=1 Tax=Biomphalaria pfeifferi TaxID=112525 RepID=A0AAD8BZ67_BIOPF|nr:hypothetical protein Bpfe_007210 [Biomphalaria pfeifferi]